MNAIDKTRPSLLRRAASGDADEFVRLYAPLAFAVARKLGLSEVDAEDIMQQTTVDLLGLLPGFAYDPRRGSFKGLVKRIVRARVTDLWRSRRHTAGVEPGDDAVDRSPRVDELIDREWEKAHLRVALDRVRDQVRPSTYQSFQLVVLEEWDVAEVAEALGMSANHVCQNKRRVMQRLRAIAKESLDECG